MVEFSLSSKYKNNFYAGVDSNVKSWVTKTTIPKMGSSLDHGIDASHGPTSVIEKPSQSYSPSASLKDHPPTIHDNPQITRNSADLSAGALPLPSTASIRLQKWNSPRINMWRVFATFWSFIILGANDAAYGAIIPYLEEWYNINYTIVSLVFLSPIVGYTCSALLNNQIHVSFGQRGVAVIMGLSHLTAYVIICLHPPYPALVVVFILAGFGSGLGDSGW